MTISKKQTGPLALIIIDGWGYSSTREGNAIALADTPYYDQLLNDYPHTLLEASGTRVGLPPGIMGNSEVGHLNIGSGRVIRMDVSRVDYEISMGEFFKNEVLLASMNRLKPSRKSLHLLGLVSDGQVHSSLEHLYALLRMAKREGLEKVFIHCFLDGRDTPPRSAVEYLEQLQKQIAEIDCGKIASVIGRYYAMDRDKRWERTKKAYDLLVNGEGEKAVAAIEAVERSYERGISDEFVEPISIITPNGEPVATVRDDDSVIFFNFRPDRARQLTRALAVTGFNEFPVQARPRVHFVCFTLYDRTFGLPIAFAPNEHHNVLAQVWGEQTVHNFRLAETEKYAHVTYFFNGGVEKAYPCERRLLVPSPKIATYDLQPEMSAFKVTKELLSAIEENATNIFVVNFANPDMVGHTGKLDQTIEACQHIDTCLSWITAAIKQAGGVTIITADHGNAEQMINHDTGQPHTAHTSNPVPFHLVDDASRGLQLRTGGALEDVAPTVLGLLDIEAPAEMTGRDLRES